MKKVSMCTLLVLFLFVSFAAADPAAVYKSLQTLVGKWEGTYQWSGARTDSGSASATYSLTGNGSALVENLFYEKGDPVMTSVYHMDAGTLRMTHYCASGNQPRLKAVSFNEDDRDIGFEMVDITNLPNPQAPHVGAVRLVLESENKISVTFIVMSKGKESRELIRLTRVPGA